jgi:hypothetical protein
MPDHNFGAEVRIRAEYAKLIAPFIGTDPGRYYLTGFYVQSHPSGGALIVATDGSSLGCFWDEFGEVAVPGIIGLRKTTLAACADERTLIVEGDRASVYELWNEETKAGILVAAQDGSVIAGEFPDWRRVIPNLPARVEVASFAHRLIQKFKNIKTSGAKSAALRVYASSSSDAAIVLTDRDDFLGVIMPFQANISDQLPRWLPPYRGKTAWPKAPDAGGATAQGGASPEADVSTGGKRRRKTVEKNGEQPASE